MGHKSMDLTVIKFYTLKYIFVLEKSFFYLLISLQWKHVKICSDSQTMRK